MGVDIIILGGYHTFVCHLQSLVKSFERQTRTVAGLH